MKQIALAAILAVLATAASGGGADVLGAQLRCDAARLCDIDVTVRHADEGWQHYADHWQVLRPDGRILGTRVLLHPHDREQPFTRSLRGLKIPPEVMEVRVRAHDKVHGLGGAEVTIAVP